MYKIFLALGSNVGNKESSINSAIELLKGRIIKVKVAKHYTTKAFGVTNQDDFLNTALVGYTKLSPEELLKFVKYIEKKLGRQKRFHWGPREIDIDILFYDDLIYETETLTIPHIGIPEREFVLFPLLDLDKNFIHPKLGKTLQELYNDL